MDLPRAGWWGGDVHVHMNYGGTYRNTPPNLRRQAQAEGLQVVENLIVNKEQRIPDIAYWQPGVDAVSSRDFILAHSEEYHTSYWGHSALLGLTDHFVLPNYVGYANTAAASLVPMNGDVFDLAHAQGAIAGYVHPFDTRPDPFNQNEVDPLRDADRRRARQGGLLRGDGIQRSPDHVGVLVPAAQLRIPDSRGRGDRRVSELRVAPRAAGAGASLCADGRAARASELAGRHQGGQNVCDEFGHPGARLAGGRADGTDGTTDSG